MRAWLLVAAFLGGCAAGSLKTEAPSGSSVFYGKVVQTQRVELDRKESYVVRGALGGIPGLMTESLTPEGWRYDIVGADGESSSVVSFSIVSLGSCVRVKQFDDGDLPVITAAKESDCSE